MTEPAIEAIGLEKSYGATRGAGRRRPAGRARQRLRAARPQRRGQDHDRADPVHAAARRTPAEPASPGTTSSPSSAQRAARDQPHRPVRGGRRAADRRGEPAHDGRGWPASAAAGARAGRGELLERFDLTEAGRPPRRRPTPAACGGAWTSRPSLVARPAVIFLDEPTTGLDPRSRQRDVGRHRELVGGGVTVFLTTQYLEEADRLADRIAVLDGGRVVAEGTAGRAQAADRATSASTSCSPTPTAFDAVARPLGDRVIVHATPRRLPLGVADRRQRRARARAARRGRPRAATRSTRFAVHTADARRRLPRPHRPPATRPEPETADV